MIQHLIDEHEKIQSLLKVLKQKVFLIEKSEKNYAQELMDIMTALKYLVRELHHHKEEAILFPDLGKLGVLESGGPKCSLFYGMKIEKDFESKVKKNITYYEKKYGKKIDPPHWIEVTQQFHAQQSPLKIPLDEHDFGYYYVHHIFIELEEYKKSTSHRGQMIPLFFDFIDLILFHIRKENECLYQVADLHLSSQVKAEMLQKAKELEKQMSDKVDFITQTIKKYS